MADDYTIRVDAGDLADIIGDRQAARADLETCIRDATEGAVQRDETIHELLSQFNGFRRAVQEALGFDQPELLHDNELVKLIQDANERARVVQLRQSGPFTRAYTAAGYSVPEPQPVEPRSTVVPMYEDFQRTEFAEQHDADETAFPEAGEQGGPPVKQDVDSAWMDTAQQRVGEQLADDGPPTENMPAVEEPPAVPDPFVIGRVFIRGDSFPDGVEGWWGVITRTGDIWELLKFNGGMAVLYCAPLDKMYTWAELTHMHGTLWEMVVIAQGRAFAWLDEWRGHAERPSVVEQALVDDEKPPAKPNLHVATLYTSQQDGGSRWYELSDGWVVCASTLQNAQRDYPDLALPLTAVRDAHQDLRDQGIVTS
jgi:hypothetical protein